MSSIIDPDLTLTNFKKFKIVFLGNQGVGKSSIIQRYIQDSFNFDSSPTVGVDFQIKNLVVNGQAYKLHLWDTAGQERFKSLIPSYIRDCQVAIIVYDVTNPQSFEEVETWHKIIQDQKEENLVLGLLGNKKDLDGQIVSTELAIKKAESLTAFFQEVSAKSGLNIDDFFRQLLQFLIQQNSQADLGA